MPMFALHGVTKSGGSQVRSGMAWQWHVGAASCSAFSSRDALLESE